MISPKTREGLRTWIEVDKAAIKKNYEAFRKLIPKHSKLMAVVKSNAYGHGLVDFSENITKLGIDWLGVDSVVEGLTLRKEGVTLPILVLGFTLPEMLDLAVENNISLTVSHSYLLEQIQKKTFAKKLKVHIKVDTGMHRQGFLESDREYLLSLLTACKDKIEIEGLYTHFATAKDPSSLEYTCGQIDMFKRWKEIFMKEGYSFLSHASATAGTILFPEAHFDMVRVGAGLYGLWPSSKVRDSFQDTFELHPTLSWKTLVVETKKISSGAFIGYDMSEKLVRDSVIGICPIGYWHGFPRYLSNTGVVLVKEKRCKILGRVSMDMIVIDLTDVSRVEIGDEVVIIGQSGGEEITAYEFADMGNAPNPSHYEAITRINPLIKKLYF